MRAQCREIEDFFVAQNLREINFCLFRVSKIGGIVNRDKRKWEYAKRKI